MISYEKHLDDRLRFFSMLYSLETLMGIMKNFRSVGLPADRFLKRFPFDEVTDPDKVAEVYGSKHLENLREHLVTKGFSPLILCPLNVLEKQRDMLNSGEVVDSSEHSPINSIEAVETAIAEYDTENATILRREEFFYWLGEECVTDDQHRHEDDWAQIIFEVELDKLHRGMSSMLSVERYFITDDHLSGAVIAGRMRPETMLLLMGLLCLDSTDVPEIVRILVERFHFTIMKEHITFSELNTHVRYPYGWSELIERDDALADSVYRYANVLDVKRESSGAGMEAMLRSLDYSIIQKLNLS